MPLTLCLFWEETRSPPYGSFVLNKLKAEDIKSVLEAIGAEAEDEKIEKLLADLEGKSVEELIKSGMDKLVSIPTGGAAAPA